FCANAFRLLVHALAYAVVVLFREAAAGVEEVATATVGALRQRLWKVGAVVVTSARRGGVHGGEAWAGRGGWLRGEAARGGGGGQPDPGGCGGGHVRVGSRAAAPRGRRRLGCAPGAGKQDQRSRRNPSQRLRQPHTHETLAIQEILCAGNVARCVIRASSAA